MREVDREKWVNRLILILLCVGLFLRLNRYLCNFPFWGDEAWVAWDLECRSFWAIFTNANRDGSLPLPPLGFLFSIKFLVSILGYREVVFRFFPCFYGLASLFLFERLLKKIVQPRVRVMAFAFFVLSNSLIYYSSELKQYSFDVFFIIFVYFFHFRCVQSAMDVKHVFRLAVVGLVSIFFSLPIILVLCGIAIPQIVLFSWRRNALAVRRYFLILSLWLLAFWGMWQSSYSLNFAGKRVISYQQQHYLSFSLTWDACGAWLQKLLAAFQDPVSLAWPLLSAGLFALGCWSLWTRKREILLVLLCPLLFTIGLSMGNKYPFSGRYLVFLLPIFYILIAQGLDYVMSDRRGWRTYLGAALLVVSLVPQIAQARNYVVPVADTDIRSLMLYIREHQKPNDTIYINNETQWGYDFYYVAFPPRYNLVARGILYEHVPPAANAGLGFFYVTPDRKRWGRVYRWDIVGDGLGGWTRLPGGGRTWILLSQIDPAKENAIIRCFNEFGTQLDRVNSRNASLYLYDLK